MEDQNAISIRYNKNYPVVQANKLIRGLQDKMTILEAKLIRLAIANVLELDTDLRTYKVSIAELADFLELDSSNIYKECENITNSLFKKEIRIQNGFDRNGNRNYKLFHWLDYVEYKDGYLTMKLSSELKPYLLGLDSLFTKYSYDSIFALPTETSIRLYELLVSYEGMYIYNIANETNYTDIEIEPGEIIFTIDYLREYFNCANKYPNTGDFIKYVIELPLNTIMANSLLRAKYRTVKQGRKIKYIVFKLVGLYTDKELEQKIQAFKDGKKNG